jgi:hypothetical protein
MNRDLDPATGFVIGVSLAVLIWGGVIYLLWRILW